MGTYDADFAAADAILNEALSGSTAATHTLPSGEETSLTVDVGNELTEQREVNGVNTLVRRMNCKWLVSDFSTVNLRATLTIAEEEWAITQLLHRCASVIVVQLERHELTEHSRPNYRRR